MISLKTKKRIASVITALMLFNIVGMPTTYADDSAKNSSGWSSQDTQAAIMSVMGVTGVGIPISSSVSYSWTSTDPRGAMAAVPICYGTKSPTIDESATYYCAIVDTRKSVAGFATASGTVKGGKQTLTGQGIYRYKDTSDPNNPTYKMATMTVNFNINGYEGKTSIGDSSTPYQGWESTIDSDSSSSTDTSGYTPTKDTTSTIVTDNDSDNDNSDDNDTDNDTNTTKYGDSLCPDGTYYCSDDTSLTVDDSTSTDTDKDDYNGYNPDNGDDTSNNGDNTSNNDDTNSQNNNSNSNNSNNGSIDEKSSTNNSDGTSKDNSSSNSDTSSSSSGTDYSDLINDLLNDNNSSYNSGNSDWASSGGASDGSENLDDYFNGLGESSEDLPSEMTDDILGVGDDMLADVPVDTDGDGIIDSMETPDGEVVPMSEYMSGDYEKSTVGGNDYDSNGGYYSNDEDNYNSGLSLQDFLGAIDGMTDGDSNLGGLNEDGSLSDRISLLLSKTNTDSGNGDQGVSEQTMYDLAKKLLLANGLTMDDIIKGKNYDKDSAFTEPAHAWDMNRITTLLKNKKIKVEGSDVIRKQDDKNTISGASNKSKAINEKNASDKKAETKTESKSK